MSASETRLRLTKGSAVHPAVQTTLVKLGQDIAIARRARSYSAQDMADRMGVDRSTLRRLEQGDPGISLNTLAMALSVLGLLHRLAEVVDQSQDDIGLMTTRAFLPKRIRRSARKAGAPEATPTPSDDGPEGW